MKKVTVIVFLFVLLLLLILPEIYLYPLYITIIKSAGESSIENATTQAIQVNNTNGRLKKIMEWEVEDFKNTYHKKPEFCLDLFCMYPVYLDSGIKIRALNSPFSNDPHWIAYFKVGGCGELASLFCEVANQVGLETRVVGPEGEEHAWNEVKMGDWKHVDPTIYYLNYTFEWFDNPQFYEEHWFNISKVSVEGTEEDVTQKYTDVGILNISFTELIDKVSITTLKNGEKRLVCSEKVNISRLKIELGGKVYNVTGEINLIPFLISRQDVKEVYVLEGEETSVELSTKKLTFKPCFYIICYIICVTLLIPLIYKLKLKNRE